jgi:hypothetical protein
MERMTGVEEMGGQAQTLSLVYGVSYESIVGGIIEAEDSWVCRGSVDAGDVQIGR